MFSFTPFELFVVVFGILGWPLTLIAAIGFAYLGYRAIPIGWKITFFVIAAVLTLPLVVALAVFVRY